MLPIKNISYLLPMCCSFWEKCKNRPKTDLGCSTPLKVEPLDTESHNKFNNRSENDLGNGGDLSQTVNKQTNEKKYCRKKFTSEEQWHK